MEAEPVSSRGRSVGGVETSKDWCKEGRVTLCLRGQGTL